MKEDFQSFHTPPSRENEEYEEEESDSLEYTPRLRSPNRLFRAIRGFVLGSGLVLGVAKAVEIGTDIARERIELAKPAGEIKTGEPTLESKEVWEKIKSIELIYMQNGRKKSVKLEPGTTEIILDGYLVDFIVNTNVESEIFFNGYDASKSSLTTRPPQSASNKTETWQYFSNNSNKKHYLGEPLTGSRENFIKLRIGDQELAIFIEQNVFQGNRQVHLEGGKGKVGNIDTTFITYLGNDPDRINKIPHIQEKMDSIAEGINNVEKLFGSSIADSVGIIDYGASNAFAQWRKKEIVFFLYGILDKQTSGQLRSTAEHEALHRVFMDLDYGGEYSLRAAFVDLKGYEGDKREMAIDSARSGFHHDRDDYPNKTLFGFITEFNFLHTAGGHPQDNVEEFLASFMHSLMYLDNLEKNLGEEFAYQQDKKTIKWASLTTAGKIYMCDVFIYTIEYLIQSTKDNPKYGGGAMRLSKNQAENLVNFFESKLKHVQEVKKKMEALRKP